MLSGETQSATKPKRKGGIMVGLTSILVGVIRAPVFLAIPQDARPQRGGVALGALSSTNASKERYTAGPEGMEKTHHVNP